MTRIRTLTASALLAAAVPAPAGAWSDDLWDALLADYTTAVDDTAGVRVDYRGLGREPRWRALVAGLDEARPEALTPPGRMAFWINAYNVLAIDLVVRGGPVDSIRDLGSLLRPVWKRDAGRAAGRMRTLDEIEHRILRPMGDPRIHAAIVCASTSCPSLRREAYRGEILDAQLEDSLRGFLADPRKGARLAEGGDVLWLSRIFDWFAGDFEAQGGVRAFLAPRLPEREASWLRARGADAPLRYFDYDWSLNAWRRSDAESG